MTPRESGSGRLATTAAPDYRGVYVDGFKDILGNSVRKDSLLNWCINHNFNAISLYDLNVVMGDERYTTLAQFISKVRVSFGIQQVTAVQGSSANFTQNASYDASRSNLNERFNVYNLETNGGTMAPPATSPATHLSYRR